MIFIHLVILKLELLIAMFDFFETDSNVVTSTFLQQLKPNSLFVPIGLCMANSSIYYVDSVSKTSTLNNYSFYLVK